MKPARSLSRRSTLDQVAFSNVVTEPELHRDLPELRLASGDVSTLDGQVIYLDFDGEAGVLYDGPVRVEGIEVPPFQAPADFVGQEAEILGSVLATLEEDFANLGVTFTASEPEAGTLHSTIYVGGDDAAFSAYGSFLGLAEQVDIGNEDPSDLALVFSEELYWPRATLEQYASALAEVIEHEAKHLLGFEHVDGHPAAEDSSPLADVAAATIVDQFVIPAWDDEGPAPIGDGQTVLPVPGDPVSSNPVTGAIEAVATHPDAAGTILVGTVGGGIWKTTDAGSGSPTWSAKTDQFASLAISAISYDRTNPNIVYAGTGDRSSFFGQGGAAIGVLKSEDGGDHWKALPAANLEGKFINAIVANGQTVLVATHSHSDGIYRSTDGGKSFRAVHQVAGTNLAAQIGGVTDLIALPPDPSRNPEFVMYAAVPGLPPGIANPAAPGIYRSDDGGVTWVLSNTGLQLVDGINQNGGGGVDEAGEDISVSQRIELAAHDNQANNTSVLYAGLVVNGSLLTVYRTPSFSANPTWTAMTPPTSVEGGVRYRTAQSHRAASKDSFLPGRRSKERLHRLRGRGPAAGHRKREFGRSQ